MYFIKWIIEKIIYGTFYIIYNYFSMHKTESLLDFNTIVKNNSLCIHAPYIGNIAFPDYYSIYIVSFLPSQQKIDFTSFKNTKYLLFSITLYDYTGKIIDSYDDVNETKNIYITSQCCMSIIRLYSNEPIKTFDNILLENNNLTRNMIQNNTQKITKIYFNLFQLRKLNIDRNIHGFHFCKENTSLYFINPRAKYLIHTMNNINNTIIIKSKKPDCGYNKPIRYFAYMTCNIMTTETNDCISCDDLQNEYTIYISKNYKNAKLNGYDVNNKSHKFIVWKQDNKYPMVVYREIRMDNNGLFSLSNDASQDDIQKAMGEYYPKVFNCIS